MPVTVLPIETHDKAPALKGRKAGTEAEAPPAVEVVTDAADSAKSGRRKTDRETDIEVIQQAHDMSAEEAVAKEAGKGYDLMFVGLEPTAGTRGFDTQISRIAAEFEEALAVVTARGIHETDPLGAPLNILVAITGSEVSRRGAEVAIAIAKAAKAPITALSVARAGASTARQRVVTAKRDDDAILKEITTLSKHYKIKIQTGVRTDVTAEDAIMRQARRGRHNLIVLGVSRRPGDILSFGPTAAALLESSERSILFVSS